MLDFQIASDLHIEYKNDDVPDPLDYITPVSDILILAGDIGCLYKFQQLKGFLERLCVHFKQVLYVAGNHEYYVILNNNFVQPLSMEILLNRLYTIEKSIHNLHILNQSSVVIPNTNICISGCTLWSKPEIVLPKFIVRIHGITNSIYEEKHKSDVCYIEKMIDYCQKKDLKLVMITHYCPTFEAISQDKKNDKYVSLYASELDNLLTSDKIHTYVFGHTHYNKNIISKGGTRVVSNQKGKIKDNVMDYSKSFVITI